MLTGYKFESIRALRSENVIAWEVLSTAKPHVNLEDYFGSMTATQRKAHFFAQLRHAMFCKDGDKYYLNATSDLLLDTDFLDRLKEETPCRRDLLSRSPISIRWYNSTIRKAGRCGNASQRSISGG